MTEQRQVTTRYPRQHPHRHPAWFASVMGTGAVALALAAQRETWNWWWIEPSATVFLVLASALAVALLPRYVARLGDGRSLHSEISDPAHGPMLATLPAGLLVLATGWGRIGPWILPESACLWMCAVLLTIGTALTVTLGLTWLASVASNRSGLESVNGGWLIPPAIHLLVPIALAPLIAALPAAAGILVLVGFAFLGIGAMLFLVFLTLLVARIAMHGPLQPVLAPSLWIPLAPAGMVGLAALRLTEAANNASLTGFGHNTAAVVVAAMGLGFGFWWFGFAALELHRVRRSGGAPAHPGWWSFVFPIGAMSISTTAVGRATDVAIVQVLGLAATAILVIVWAVVLAATLPMLRPMHSADRAAPTLS